MIESIGFIHYPGMRSRAFLGTLLDMGVHVSTVIEMVAEIPNLAAIREEARRYGYDKTYFDTGMDLESFFERSSGTQRIPTLSTSINDPAIAQALDGCGEEIWIFSGGGILKPHLFKPGRHLLHVHPGRIPEFRGSTCFYYSLLARRELVSTCFLLEPKLDAGQILFEASFSHNLLIRPDQSYFMDAILDPWMRATALRGALSRPLPEAREGSTEEEDGNAYFVAHPFLRHLAIERMNARFRPSNPEGVFSIEDRGQP
ncbi:MAG: hypothetical protein IPK50_09260 [Fibrobacterota bacterium]|nr:hypothetical protein [Fibrobacterota bacterium]QQS07065.1 MAG: hypothetical protein IPK50_09260 [Fibrobacterota bacterium]